jgi:hypothetical protein
MPYFTWIRLDIPYQNDASAMRFIAAYTNNKANFSIYESPSIKNIPELLQHILDLEQKNFKTNQDTIVVYPLDDRIGLTDFIRETTQNNGWKFERNIPSENYPGVQLKCGFELDLTGSAEDVIPSDAAQQRVFELNLKAQKSFEKHNILAAFSFVRHALQLSYQQFGWATPGVAYCLINFGHLILASNNKENHFEIRTALNRLLYQWDVQGLDKDTWDGAHSILEQLINISEQLELPSYSDRFSDFEAVLF